MPTTPLRVYTGKEVLLAYYNRQFQRNIGLEDIDFDVPVKLATPTNYNTVIRLYPRLGSRYYGSPRLFYDRIHVSMLGTIVVDKGSATKVHDLLNRINEKYSISITEEDVVNETLDPFTNGNIVVNLKIEPTSVMFYEGPKVYTPNYPDPATLPGPVIEQYAFWSPVNSSSNVVLSNNNTSALMNNEHAAITQISISDGKVYWEVTVDSGGLYIGVAIPGITVVRPSDIALGSDAYSWALNTLTGELSHDSSTSSYINPIPAGSIVGVMLDKPAGLLTFIVGNVQQTIAFSGLNLYNDLYPVICGADGANSKGTGNFGEFPFFYQLPTGYNKGVYTVYTPGNTVVPPAGGTGGISQPAGTILGTFCQEEDKWTIVSDGAGKFVITLAEADSIDCGFDLSNPPIIDGGDAGSGGVGLAMLSAMGGPFTMDEDNPKIINYGISTPVVNPISLNFTINHGTSSPADLSVYEYSVESPAVWVTMSPGDSFIVPANVTTFSIRLTAVADMLTEGFETFHVVLTEDTPVPELGNSVPVSTAIVISDTSIVPGAMAELTTSAGIVNVDEGSTVTVAFDVTGGTITTPVSLQYLVTHDSTDSLDFSLMEYNINGTTGWTTIAADDVITLDNGDTGLSVRLTTSADKVTEGPEKITIGFVETVIGTGLINTGPVVKEVNIADTSMLMLAHYAGATVMDEGTEVIHEYYLNQSSHAPVTLQLDIENITTAAADFVNFKYRFDNNGSWTTTTSGDTLQIPTNRQSLFINVGVVSDLLTEGDESFNIVLTEVTPVLVLGNTSPISVTVTITDTSTGTGFPEPPPPAQGFTGDGSYTFITDPDDEFGMGETGGTSGITWVP